MREYLKELRKTKEFTQEDVSVHLGVRRQSYNLIENGKRRKKLDIELANKLAGLFGVSLDFILTEEQKLHQTV